ncbi:hypothetical protein [Treponema pedis]|uniref:hypothetical protein n=1 Tax=Treponema pedis TaxID=409322 RepID=UPI00041ECD6B|nr:hypothetical protein [Treponema pedis]QSI03676.1 hypothetical protein DYQ05_01475 [Treponema pedis]
MKKGNKIIITVFIAFAVLFSACKSTPETKPAAKPEPEAVKPESEMTEKPAEEKMESAEDTEKARLLAELEKVRDGRLKAARETAVELGADNDYPDKFSEASAVETNAANDTENGNLKEAIDKYNEAADRYETLSNLMKASSFRNEIEEYGFARFSAEDYVEAERLSINALDHYELDYKMAKETSEDALKLYESIANKGYFEFTKIAKDEAKEHKADCDSIKVARSRTEDYNAAVRLFNEGKAMAEEGNYRASFYAYNKSGEGFKTLYNEVSAKRAEAEAAMAEAARKQEESSALALEADKEAPLTEAGEGFSDGELDLEDKTTEPEGEAENIDETEEPETGMEPVEEQGNSNEGGQ